jgi:hypothetical protein
MYIYNLIVLIYTITVVIRIFASETPGTFYRKLLDFDHICQTSVVRSEQLKDVSVSVVRIREGKGTCTCPWSVSVKKSNSL